MEIITEIKEHYAVVQLNRPKKLNSLSYEMIHQLETVFQQLEQEESIHFILLEGAGERAFCAGGDVVEVYRNYLEPGKMSPEYFHDEFRLDDFVAKMKTPLLAHWKGVTMGGGVGLSMGCDFIVADDTVKWAMPETALGIIPDVGVGYFFSQMARGTGLYLSLTGRVITGADTRRLGLSRCYIPAKEYAALRQELLQLDFSTSVEEVRTEIADLLARYDREPEETEFSQHAEAIEQYFNQPTVEAIMDGLARGQDAFAKEEFEHMSKLCPKSLVLLVEKYEQGKQWTRSETFQIDEAVLFDAMKDGNMGEGIRSKMIDKDNNPHYCPATIDGVNREHIRELLSLKK